MAVGDVMMPVLVGRFDKTLNPCRVCGEPAHIQRRDLAYLCGFEFRIACPAVCWPFYIGESFSHVDLFANANTFYEMLFAALRKLANAWNHYHDGPSFFAGLA